MNVSFHRAAVSSAALLLLALAAAPAVAQTASFSTFGTSCTDPSIAPPMMGNIGLPVLGSSYTVTYSGPNRATWPTELRPVLLTGLQATSFVIPVFSSSQPANCAVLVAPLLIQMMGPDPASPIRFASQVTFQVPNDPRLIGVSVFHQWVALNQTCLVIGCNTNALLVSEAANATIGL